MIFKQIRYRLMWSYLAVLTVILGSFAIAVRIVFIHSLTHELIEELTTIAQAATTDIEVENGTITVTDDEVIVNNEQAVQWFDLQGNLIKKQGNAVIRLPFNPQSRVETKTTPLGIQAVNITIFDRRTKLLIGYVQVSESMKELARTFRRLDFGLGGGFILSLVLSAIGSIWLTRQAMEPIEQNFRKLQQFTADASHELRTPLMAIKSNAAVALKYPEGMRELDQEKFHAIASATAQMSGLTEDLLMLARTDRSLPNKQEVVNLNSLLIQLIQLYQPQAETKQIHLQINRIEELSVWGNGVQLMRLFTNLIDNALRYTPAEGIVEIKANRNGNDGLFSVRDTGIGIAPENLEQVFDRFWRADEARSSGAGGFGLGLAIAQGIAQLHGGEITVTSEVGVGSCFTVRLPLHTDSTAF